MMSHAEQKRQLFVENKLLAVMSRQGAYTEVYLQPEVVHTHCITAAWRPTIMQIISDAKAAAIYPH